jgi:outer membrane usher protein
VLAGQSPVPPDAYLSNFTAAHTEFQYGLNLLGLISCDSAQILGGTVTPVFAVTALVDKNCLVGTTDVDFGTHGVLATDVAAVGAVTVECTPDTTYTVALDNGVTGTGPTARLMTASGAAITYGLYQDAAHTEPWGQTGVDVVAGTGSGAAEVHDVYGLVPAQATPAPGVYQDTVVVTVAY